MKRKVKSIICIMLALAVTVPAVSGLSGVFAADSESFANADSVAFDNGIIYDIDENGRVYSTDTGWNFKNYYTDYPVNQIALLGNIIYFSCGEYINAVNRITLEEYTVCTTNGDIVDFAVTDSSVFVLCGGEIGRISKNGEYSPVAVDDGIDNFWLESSAVLCYMNNDEYINTVNLITGYSAVEKNEKSSLDYLDVPVDGESRSAAGATISLTALKNKYPDGKYWNHANNPGTSAAKNNAESYTNTPCPDHNGTIGTSRQTCNEYYGCYQCMGYAYKCGYDVTGYSPGSAAGGWSAKKYEKTDVDKVKAGDVIRYISDGHSIYVTSVSGDTITFTDCNWGNTCKIRWGATVNKTTVKNSFTWLISSPGIDIPEETNSITFDANGGECSTGSITVIPGQKIGTLPVPTKDGYTFGGWFTEKTGGTEYTADTVYQKNGPSVLYAHWNSLSFRITYLANAYNYEGREVNVEMPEIQTKKHGTSVKLSTVTPSRTGYKFKSWNTAADGSGTSYAPGAAYKTNADLTLYAQWEAISERVDFYQNDGTTSKETKFYDYGSPYGTLPSATRAGYDFVGWFTEKEHGEQVAETDIVTNLATLRLYAHWKSAEYTVAYDANGGTGAPAAQTKKYQTDITLSKDKPERAGHTFLGWSVSPSDKTVSYHPGDVYKLNSSITLYAVWSAFKYTVKFDGNGNTDSVTAENQIFDYDVAQDLYANVFTRTGYKFAGWSLTKGGSVKYSDKENVKNLTDTPDATVTLYAVWKANEYTLYFYPNGGTDYPDSKNVKYDDKYGTLPGISRSGYDFAGWSLDYDSKNIVSSSDKINITEDTCLVALWTKKSDWSETENGAEHNLIYDYGFDKEPKIVSVKAGQAINAERIEKNEQRIKFVKELKSVRPGYNFTGWSEIPCIMPDSDVTVTAKYTAIKYTASFYADGRLIKSYTYTLDDSSIPTPSIPSKAGYTGKWADHSVLKIGGMSINAIYTPITYQATFIADGKTVKVVDFNLDDGIVEPKVPKKKGYYGHWEAYTLQPKNIVITAVYDYDCTINISGYKPMARIPFMATVKFIPHLTGTNDSFEIHWFVNGNDMGADADGCCTVSKAKSQYTVQVKLMNGNEVISQSGLETVNVTRDILSYIRAFIQMILGRLPVYNSNTI